MVESCFSERYDTAGEERGGIKEDYPFDRDSHQTLDHE